MGYGRFRLLAAAWLLIVFVGCGGGGSSVAASETVQLTVSKSGGGAIVSMPAGIYCTPTCTGSFPKGTTVKLAAVAGGGYDFVGWTGACAAAGGGVCTLSLDQSRSVRARFAKPSSTVALTVSKSGSGDVTSLPTGIVCGHICSKTFATGAAVTLTATPAPGASFSGWTGACTGSGTSCTVAMSSARSVTATFSGTATDGNTLAIAVTGSGRVSSNPGGLSCSDDCSATFAPSTSVTLTATPNAGQVFNGWAGDACRGRDARCTLSMSAAHSVSAFFMPAPAPDGACAGFYADGFSLVAGEVVTPWVTSPKPVRGVAATEPSYKTCRTRVTDHTADGLATFARNDYSRRQAFNADNTRQLVYAYNGYWHLYDASYRHVSTLPASVAGDAEPQWHPANPDLLYYLPTNGVGMKVYEMNVRTGVSRTVGDLASRLKARWPTANAAWTKSEGSPSADLRYWCFMVDSGSWGGLGLVTWDMATDTILGMHDLGGVRPDHVSMSPSGNYCVSSNYGGPGVVAYARDFSTSRKIADIGEHSDIGIDANGDDAYVSIDYQSAGGDVFSTNLRTGVRTVLFPSYAAGTGSAVHFSAKAFRKPGWVVMSAYAENTNAPPYVQQWFHRKLTVIELKANPRIYNLGTTHVAYNGYWTEPQASVNRDLTKIVWTSNWDLQTDTDTDVYLFQIPAAAVK